MTPGRGLTSTQRGEVAPPAIAAGNVPRPTSRPVSIARGILIRVRSNRPNQAAGVLCFAAGLGLLALATFLAVIKGEARGLLLYVVGLASVSIGVRLLERK